MILSNDTIRLKPPYKINNNIISLISLISERIGEINAAHLSKPPAELRKSNRIKTIQSSLEIEGNTLTIEQITAIIENRRVVGPQKDIVEVKNAIIVYEKIDTFNPYNLKSFCKAHELMMHGLVESAGRLRNKAVGIVKGSEIKHIAPKGDLVKSLMNDLFSYLKYNEDIVLIKSCVFQYELEFIHPFIDGNGRMGRLWQTVVLRDKYPVFEYLPIETLIKRRQAEYYDILDISDRSGESTLFIEFMLEIIKESLEELLHAQNIALTNSDRITIFRSIIKDEYFSRKHYLRYFKEISTATASRDMQFAAEAGILEKIGDKNSTIYKYL